MTITASKNKENTLFFQMHIAADTAMDGHFIIKTPMCSSTYFELPTDIDCIVRVWAE